MRNFLKNGFMSLPLLKSLSSQRANFQGVQVVTACTASATSCTRSIAAPRSNAMVLRAVVPGSDVEGVPPVSLNIMDLREMPTRMGKLRDCSSARSAMML